MSSEMLYDKTIYSILLELFWVLKFLLSYAMIEKPLEKRGQS